jgi:apolipoprotein N-acyltransferase
LVTARVYYSRQAVFAIAHAVSLLFALSPFDFWPLGFCAPLFLLLAADEQRDKGTRQILLGALLFSFATTAVTFGWIFATIWRYSAQNAVLSLALSVLYAVIFQLKFPLVFVMLRAGRLTLRQHAFAPLAVAAALALGDALAPELFPWSWGNGIAAQAHLRQLAAVGSVYLMSFFAALAASVFLYLWFKRREAFFAVCQSATMVVNCTRCHPRRGHRLSLYSRSRKSGSAVARGDRADEYRGGCIGQKQRCGFRKRGNQPPVWAIRRSPAALCAG